MNINNGGLVVTENVGTVYTGYVVGKDPKYEGRGRVGFTWKVKVTDRSDLHGKKFAVLTAKSELATGLDVKFYIACIGPRSKKERAVEVTVLTK